MKRQSARYRKEDGQWFSPTGTPASDKEQELLDEIEMLTWEMEILQTKLQTIIDGIRL